MSRPEHIAPPEVFYNEIEASKYGGNSRMIEIQTKMTERAIQLGKWDKPGSLILDLGCGSGISGEVLSEHGHCWVGLDISPHMLLVREHNCCGK
jgi:18S rRNA (guanine1575-N7)-methyltransferase